MSTYVRIRVGAERYAIPVGHVVEVCDLDPAGIVPVPGARPEVLGVRNLRGLVLPVVDLAAVLRVPRAAPPGGLLVAESGGARAGLAIDRVVGVEEMGEPSERCDSPLLAGAILSDGQLTGVIDVPRVFGALEAEGS